MTNRINFDPGFHRTAFAHTKIDMVSENGRVEYSGHNLEDLVLGKVSFLEVVYLLNYGKFPSKEVFERWEKTIISNMNIPPWFKEVILIICEKNHLKLEEIRKINPALAVRIILSFSEFFEKEITSKNDLPVWIGKVSALIFAFMGIYQKKIFPINHKPDHELGFIENCCSLLTQGEDISQEEKSILEKFLILRASHGAANSTTEVRMVASAGGGLNEACVGGLINLATEKHGAATLETSKMINEILKLNIRVEDYLKRRLKKGLIIYGFGHPIYKKVEDPRTKLLLRLVREIFKYKRNSRSINLEKIECNLKIANKLRRKAPSIIGEFREEKCFANMDLYSPILLQLLGISPELDPLLFITSRILSSWPANFFEQKEKDPATKKSNPIIRPLLIYHPSKSF